MDINNWLKNHPVGNNYGAPIGDRGCTGDPDAPYKFHLQKLDMVCSCYDRSGTYWGAPSNNFGHMFGFMCEHDEDGLVYGFVRAENRAAAKRLTRDTYPNATFYR